MPESADGSMLADVPGSEPPVEPSPDGPDRPGVAVLGADLAATAPAAVPASLLDEVLRARRLAARPPGTTRAARLDDSSRSRRRGRALCRWLA